MGKKYKKYKNFLEKFLDSSGGKRFFNIVYSVGAAIVIIGAMAKILHWPFGNEMLMIGMITEAIVFLLSAFEKPDKDYKWEEVFPALSENENFIPRSERVNQADRFQQSQQTSNTDSGPAIRSTAIPTPSASVTGTATPNGRTTNVQQQSVNNTEGNESNSMYANMDRSGGAGNTSRIVVVGGDSQDRTIGRSSRSGSTVTQAGESSSENKIEKSGVSGNGNSVDQLSQMADNMDKFAKATETLTQISESLQKSFSTIIDNSEGIGNNTQNYITQMEALNRNIAGLNTIYEVQLKGVSGQINTIEHINAGLDRIKKLYDGSLADSSIFKNETEKMAQQLSELNSVYSRLLKAMTTNMGGGFTPPNTESTSNRL